MQPASFVNLVYSYWNAPFSHAQKADGSGLCNQPASVVYDFSVTMGRSILVVMIQASSEDVQLIESTIKMLVREVCASYGGQRHRWGSWSTMP
eukprot:scaffold583579_cov37-Prasinocladus_malaysianus.AAC.1